MWAQTGRRTVAGGDKRPRASPRHGTLTRGPAPSWPSAGLCPADTSWKHGQAEVAANVTTESRRGLPSPPGAQAARKQDPSFYVLRGKCAGRALTLSGLLRAQEQAAPWGRVQGGKVTAPRPCPPLLSVCGDLHCVHTSASRKLTPSLAFRGKKKKKPSCHMPDTGRSLELGTADERQQPVGFEVKAFPPVLLATKGIFKGGSAHVGEEQFSAVDGVMPSA